MNTGRSRKDFLRRMLQGFLGLLLMGLLASPSYAGSCGKLRSFVGTVESSDARSVTIRRGGGQTRFERFPQVEVVDEAGSGARGWNGLRSGWRVMVCWAFEDSPRYARKVFVIATE